MRPLENHSITSIYFGGGTPTLFGAEPIAQILSLLPKAQEITLEANPEDVTPSLMKSYRDAGINRVSIGVQSLQDDSLHILEEPIRLKKQSKRLKPLTMRASLTFRSTSCMSYPTNL